MVQFLWQLQNCNHFISCFEHLQLPQRPGPQVHVAMISFISRIISPSTLHCYFGRKLPSVTFLHHPQFVRYWFGTLNSHSFQIQPSCKAAHLVCFSNPFLDKVRLRGLKDVHLENWFILNRSKLMSRLEFCWYTFIRKEPSRSTSILLIWSDILLKDLNNSVNSPFTLFNSIQVSKNLHFLWLLKLETVSQPVNAWKKGNPLQLSAPS